MAGGGMRAVSAGVLCGVVLSFGVDYGAARLLPDVDSSIWYYRVGAGAMLLFIGCAAALAAARTSLSVDPREALQGK